MSTLGDLKKATKTFNEEYPRPNMGELKVSDLYDIVNDWGKTYPSSKMPGVYVFLGDQEEVLYVGKASCKQCMGNRLGAHFCYAADKKRGQAKTRFFQDVRYIAVVPVPVGRAFEAPALEEFLVKQLQPPLNTQGKQLLTELL